MNAQHTFKLAFMSHISGKDCFRKELFDAQSVNEKEEDKELLKMDLEEHSRRMEEIVVRDLKSTMLWHV